MPVHQNRHHAPEGHRTQRVTWLRAAVLGANDGIVSTAALMLGVASASDETSAAITAGLAGLIAGSLSMAVGEYVSVPSQRDAEHADLQREIVELHHYPEAELRELTEIYVSRGLDRELAREVAVQLHEHDALGAHLRDELNLTPDGIARPVQAAVVSALWFAMGAIVPLLVGWWAPAEQRVWWVGGAAVVALIALGSLSARLGGAHRGRAAARVLVGGSAAIALTTTISNWVGAVG